MTWDGNGTFNPPGLPEFPAAAGDLIKAEYFNTVINALCEAFLNVVPRDGQAPVQGHLDFGGTYRPYNLPAATANGQAVRYNELATVIAAVTAGQAAITDLQLVGLPVVAKGNSGTTAQVINMAVESGQTLTATGDFVMSTTGAVAGRLTGVLLKAINFGTHMSSTGITWKKADGSETTTFSAAGYTMQTSGSNFICLLSYGDGIVYGFVR